MARKSPSWRDTASGAAVAAEITPIEPVWVIPAKGAALCRIASPLSKRVAIIGAGVVGPRHRLAAGGARRFRHGVRQRRGRRGRQPRRRRHAGRLLRGRAGRGSAGRAWPRQPGALAGLCGRAAGGLRHRRGIAHRRHAGDRARPPTTRRGSIIISSSSKKLGLPLQWISAAETRRREPHLAGKLAGAVWSPEDHQVDNRKLAAALRVAAEAAGATIREHTPVKEIAIAGRTRQWRRAG